MDKSPALKLMTFVTEHLNSHHSRNDKISFSKVHTKTLLEVRNDYHKEQLPSIPAGSQIITDFGCDSGIYAMADIKGEIHKVLIPLNECHKIDWAEHQDFIDKL